MFTDQKSVWTAKLIFLFIVIVWTAFSIIMNFSSAALGSTTGLLNSFVSLIFFELWLALSALNGWTKSRGYIVFAIIYFASFAVFPSIFFVLQEHFAIPESINMFRAVLSLPILTPLSAMPNIPFTLHYPSATVLLVFALLNFLAYFVFKAKSPMVSASS